MAAAYADRMKIGRWLRWAPLAAVAAGMWAQTPELDLPRPGTIILTEVTGRATAMNGDERKTLKADDRLRVGGTVETDRRSVATLLFSNGASVQLGSTTELEVEEFGQVPVSSSVKYAELKEEPTLSRTKLRLVRGDAQATVKPLKAARGSSFTLTLPAGTVRIREGTIRVLVQMSELGLGVCDLELLNGLADFEPVGGKFTPIPVGKKLALAVEQDKKTGAIKMIEMPKPAASAAK